uniref:hypothetical protein n=1 Tax=Pseudomonas fluorescens TaxID=294 RepID=UPI0015954886|nr:hypothetical protein [Pseudomonas fluorescens]
MDFVDDVELPILVRSTPQAFRDIAPQLNGNALEVAKILLAVGSSIIEAGVNNLSVVELLTNWRFHENNQVELRHGFVPTELNSDWCPELLAEHGDDVLAHGRLVPYLSARRAKARCM